MAGRRRTLSLPGIGACCYGGRRKDGLQRANACVLGPLYALCRSFCLRFLRRKVHLGIFPFPGTHGEVHTCLQILELAPESGAVHAKQGGSLVSIVAALAYGLENGLSLRQAVQRLVWGSTSQHGTQQRFVHDHR